MLERGLDPDFPAAALSEAARAHAAPTNSRPSGLRDLRSLLWCSIDNDDSRDLDQLTVAERSNGGTVIRIAVADVSGVVSKDSGIDRHAALNTTSVYTEAQIFPMLPLRLSNDLTSLNQDDDRLAIVVEAEVTEGGSVTHGDVYPAVVRNHAKLTYHDVGEWLEQTAAAPGGVVHVAGLAENLQLQDEAARRLQAARYELGALELEADEAKAVFDDGMVLDLKPREKNRAAMLIEDFMIAANGVTARFLESHGMPAMRRVVKTPEKWGRIVQLAWDHQTRLPDAPDARALAEFLRAQRAADPENFPILSLAVLKLLGRGQYVAEMPGDSAQGHFGLAVDAYTHSTAPNRRFPDLITQRLIKSAIAGNSAPYRPEELVALAAHCTEQEDNAKKVERAVRKSAAALLLERRIGATFDGVVTGASAKGTWVRVWRPMVEGKLEVKGDDRYQVGDRVRVRLVHTDVERGFIDFDVAGPRPRCVMIRFDVIP
jgi:VacB/RNase II family 3'-5' exoribonuclease